jgi:hypothetical protein
MTVHRNVSLDPTLANLIEVSVELVVPSSDLTMKKIFNVWHFFNGTGEAIGAFDPTSFATTFRTNYQDVIETGLNSSSTLTFIGCRALNDPTNMQGGNSYNVAGSSGGDRLPTDNAVVINLATGARGRSFQGRKHFTPISESFTTGDILTGNGTTTWMNVRDAIRSTLSIDVDGLTWNMVVLSPTLSDLTASPVVATFTDVIDASLNLTLGTMRRRKERTQVAPG